MVERTGSEPSASSLAGLEWLACLGGEAGERVRNLLTTTLADTSLTTTKVRVAYARAGRLAAAAKVAAERLPQGVPEPLEGWQAEQIARMAVLLAAVERISPAEQVALVETLFRTGGEQEQKAVLRSLAYLPEPGRFADLAAEATRTNVTTVLAALACENPFPAAHLPELNFNQMVLKSIFLGIDTSRVVGLETRVTPELVRMLQDYGAERRAAGRVVPADVDRISQLLANNTAGQ